MEHIAAVENYLTLEALFILKYVLVLNEYYNHIHIAEELVEARVLVLCNLMPFKKWNHSSREDVRDDALVLRVSGEPETRDSHLHSPCR